MLRLWHFVAFLSLANKSCRSISYKEMSPIQLIDLIRNEQKVPFVQEKTIITDAPYHQGDNSVDQDIEPGPSEDDKLLKIRKVWSRWSKWGQCSVTCGRGTIERHRVCVAGRCAPGEREEQHRPCAKVPCAASLYNMTMTDELRELE